MLSPQAWMPFSSYLIVRVQPRILMAVIVSCWGVALCGMAASTGPVRSCVSAAICRIDFRLVRIVAMAMLCHPHLL
ncbi:hypothetical protein B0H10DRAFT_1979762 [Mycena sp. CBHHK59/15]|nr:hypothetical protein B0H10DRAFT_1979762 [Mycena sp. CBHHK59/15]